MSEHPEHEEKAYGAKFRTVNLDDHFNWPPARGTAKRYGHIADLVRAYPEGLQRPWGIRFRLGSGERRRVILVATGRPEVRVPLRDNADFLCLLHEWHQITGGPDKGVPCEGVVVAEYEIVYRDGTSHVQPVRARFEVGTADSAKLFGPPWVAVYYPMAEAIDPVDYPAGTPWGWAQGGVTWEERPPLVYALPNPNPEKRLESLTIRGLQESPLVVAGLTLYRGGSHPLRHLPRRLYRVNTAGGPSAIETAEVDLGGVARIERTKGPCGKRWLNSPYAGVYAHELEEPGGAPETLVEAFGSEDATVSVKLAGKREQLEFSLGEAFHRGEARASSGRARLQVLGKERQWMRVVVRDSSTGRLTPVRIHFAGSRGEYVPPYGHPSQINTGWFMDYGADVEVLGRPFAYVPGEFMTDLPVGDLYVEMCKGFEYAPVRKKVKIEPRQKVLDLTVHRWADWRSQGWVTADTHVHFLSPHTAALEAQGEGVNIVNLLASQWGRLFTNVGDFRGRVGVIEDETIVYVGTENRNHMLGHMSMLGTEGLPVYPMCTGGPSEAWVGDPDFRAMAEWALENKRKGGLVIRPHFPYCGHTEDPVPILRDLVNALELADLRGESFPAQEWYRYLNCGYRVAVCGGTDKMGAYCPLGYRRTYAKLDPQRPFDYANWADAVRAGRTFATSGPLIDISIEGRSTGETVGLPASGGTLEVEARAESFRPLGKIEIVHDGAVVTAERAPAGSQRLCAKAKVRVDKSGWIAARCTGSPRIPGGDGAAAHTSPVYLTCGGSRAFCGPAAQHMLSLVEGGIEYLQTLATAFDESSRKRMVKLYKEAQRELQDRLLGEAEHAPRHGGDADHTHGHEDADHADR